MPIDPEMRRADLRGDAADLYVTARKRIRPDQSAEEYADELLGTVILNYSEREAALFRELLIDVIRRESRP